MNCTYIKMHGATIKTPRVCFWGNPEPEMSCERRPDWWRFRSCGYLKLEKIMNTWFNLYWKVNGSTCSYEFSKWLSSFPIHNCARLSMERFVRVPFVQVYFIIFISLYASPIYSLSRLNISTYIQFIFHLTYPHYIQFISRLTYPCNTFRISLNKSTYSSYSQY